MTTPANKPSIAPAFQFYPKDFLSSSKVQRMSLTEVGIYIKLLSHCWLLGTLPNDMKKLAGMVGMKSQQLERTWPNVLSECFTVKGDRLIQDRLDQERKKQDEYRRRQSDRGKQGGRPKSAGLSSAKQDVLSRTKPEKSSSSPISDLQSSTPVKIPSGSSRASLIAPRRMDAAFEGQRGLYVPKSLHQRFVSFRNHPDAEAELQAFYLDTSNDFTDGPRSHEQPDPDMFKYWTARFAERFPATGRNGSGCTGAAPRGKYDGIEEHD